MDLKSKKVKTAEFKVIEFNKEFKRVVVSHTGIFRDEEKKNVKDLLLET
jgi:small subunit ribosomal protein S1